MKRPVCKTTLTRYPAPRHPAGYTMVEVLVATALMLTIMLGVAWVFGMVGETIADSRSTLEMTGQLRSVTARLKMELDGITVTMSPPRDPASNEGYFEITEGAIGPVISRGVARNLDRTRTVTASDAIPYEIDTTVGDFDDMLMFTTRSRGAPFVGRIAQKLTPDATHLEVGQDDPDGDGTYDTPYSYEFKTIQSDVAEIAYFVRGGTLYRRVLLVKPDFPRGRPFWGNMDRRNDPALPANPITESVSQLARNGFYNNDVSVRLELQYNSATSTWGSVMAANTLGDLTKRENRFAHRPAVPATGAATGFPYHPHWWFDWSASARKQTGWATFVGSVSPWRCTGLGLPTLEECSHPNWQAGGLLPNPVVNSSLTFVDWYDAWSNPHPYAELDQTTGSMLAYTGHVMARIGEDVVLTNVVGFDVKVWDPGAVLLPGTDANGTYTDRSVAGFDTTAEFTDDTTVPGVALAPGDLGYGLAWAHYNYSGAIFQPVGMGAYVDLGHGKGTSAFAGAGNFRSRLGRVYDTWSTHYESNWLDWNLNGLKDWIDPTDSSTAHEPGNEDRDRNGTSLLPYIDEGTDGLDNDNNGVIDDLGEQEAPAPYPVPLRGIQIKIRVFDTDSRQVRERTIVCDFLAK